jgi:hypothetical protein
VGVAGSVRKKGIVMPAKINVVSLSETFYVVLRSGCEDTVWSFLRFVLGFDDVEH